MRILECAWDAPDRIRQFAPDPILAMSCEGSNLESILHYGALIQ